MIRLLLHPGIRTTLAARTVGTVNTLARVYGVTAPPETKIPRLTLLIRLDQGHVNLVEAVGLARESIALVPAGPSLIARISYATPNPR